MGCKCATSLDYAACAQAAVQQITDDNTISHYAAMAGATSSNWTMCVVKAFLYARRLIYYKSTPGDCGTSGFNIDTTTLGIAAGVGGAAKVDPEPISKGVLSGLSAIFGLFGAHHAQAVATEQATICAVSTYFNQALVALENAVKAGNMGPDDASQIISQVADQLDPKLAAIAKPCNASCGFRIGMRALVSFESEIVFPALVPSNLPDALFSQPVTPSPGAPGTYGAPGGTAPLPVASVPPLLAPNPSYVYYGASGPTPSPMNGNNGGAPGPSSLLTPGTILLIGGVAFVASKV